MSGVSRIADERRRQIEEEKWSNKHDDRYMRFELTNAAVCYINEAGRLGIKGRGAQDIPDRWPMTWCSAWWRPSPKDSTAPIDINDAIKMLTKAGALVAAEIDRLERLGE